MKFENQDTITSALDYSLKSLKLTTLSGREIKLDRVFSEIDVFESLTNPFISAKIKLLDAVGILESFEVFGGETVEIRVRKMYRQGKQLEDDLKFKGIVYKVSDRTPASERVEVYTIHCISEEFIENQKKKISQKFGPLLYSDIAERIFKNELNSKKKFNKEKTLGKQVVHIPNHNPFQALAFLAGRSYAPPTSKGKSSNNKNSCFLFFENKDGFNFRSIEDLISKSKESGQYFPEYFYQPVSIANTKGNKEVSGKDLFTIEDYTVDHSFDILDGLTNGFYGNSLVTFDYITGEFSHSKQNFEENFDRLEHTDTKAYSPTADSSPLKTGTEQSVIRFLPSSKSSKNSSYIKEKIGQVYDSNFEEFYLQQVSKFARYFGTHSLNLKIPGDTMVKVGMMCYINLPSYFDQLVNKEPNKYYSGAHLITNVRHNITQSEYKLQIQVVKPSILKKVK